MEGGGSAERSYERGRKKTISPQPGTEWPFWPRRPIAGAARSLYRPSTHPEGLCAAAHSTFLPSGGHGSFHFWGSLEPPFLPSTLLADLSGGKRPSAGSNAGVAPNLVRGKGETRACLHPPRDINVQNPTQLSRGRAVTLQLLVLRAQPQGYCAIVPLGATRRITSPPHRESSISHVW